MILVRVCLFHAANERSEFLQVGRFQGVAVAARAVCTNAIGYVDVVVGSGATARCQFDFAC